MHGARALLQNLKFAQRTQISYLYGTRRFSTVQEEFLDCLTLEDGTDKLSRNVGN